MRSIGIRELRQHASRHLRDVQAGETIEVTDRGRPIARLTPVPAGDRYEALIASGRLVPGDGDLLDIELVEPAPGLPLPSQTLDDMRRDER
jgi:prevent-host-death family protein